MSKASDVTQILGRITGGEKGAFDELFPLVYDELRAIARRHMRADAGHTLQPTALVNEVCIKLLGQDQHHWTSRSHFLSAASRAMRHVLVDYARRRLSQKRGGDRTRQNDQLDGLEAPGGLSLSDVIALDEALARFAIEAPRKAKVVELLYFAGLSSAEAAHVLGVDRKTVHRDRVFALAWLNREMAASG